MPASPAATGPAPSVPAVALDDVSVVRAGRTIWSHGTFEVPAGSVVGIIGPNGSGKTTLLEVLLGLLPIAGGEVEVLGGDPRRGDRRIGYVPQGYGAALGDAVSCRDLVALGVTGTRWGLGRPSPAENARIDAALQAVGASEYARRRMSQLSGGQQQRVAIAQALVDEPELLLLDEPLANLDIRNQHGIVSLLGRIRDERRGDERQVTILLVAHDLNPLLPVLDGAIYLLDGHPHFGAIGEVVDGDLLTHLYGTPIRVVRTAQGDLFTRSA